ncbi:AAA family ATPase [Paenibacillus sp. ALJ109b]|uniref:AAA family ATPase n=1 Tax=Paenibacillus sp. ALJ109b TaxID=2709068 RepID=UPI0013D2DBC1|nr:AAA family ATPase [Paenibacillus sp. ALJ109b]NEU61876.1 AAA family ATPase [Paenibacillus sp. ALJ109b]
MFIKQIEVDKFKKLENFKLIFPESNILDLENDKKMKLSVIVGENGTAKTTIFQLIINSFAKTLDKDFDATNYKVEYLLDNNEYIKTKDYKESIELPSSIVVSSYTPIDKLDIESNHHSYSNISIIKANINVKSVKVIATRILKKFASNEFEEVYSILSYIGYEKREIYFELSDYQIKSNYALNKVIKKLNVMKEEEYNFNLVNLDVKLEDRVCEYNEILEEFSRCLGIRYRSMFPKKVERYLSSPHRPLRGMENISFKDEFYIAEAIFILEKFSILLKASKNIESYKKEKEIKLISIVDVNYYPGGKEKLLIDIEFMESFSIDLLSDIWFQTDFDKDTIPLSMLSSGELSMFMRFFDLHEYVNHNSIVLIDEPETHLHPKWIRGYIKTLIDLLGNRKCHVIIATHSPLIVSDVTKNCIIGLKKNKYDIKQFKIDDKTLGLNYEEVLSEIFDLEDFKGEMINEYIDVIDRLLELGNFDKALKIYAQIGDSEIKYQLFLKLKAFKELKGDRHV